MRIIKLDNFLDKNLRMIFLYTGIVFSFGFINSLNNFVSFSSITITFFSFIMTVLSYIIIKLKKALVEKDGLLFNSLLFADKIVFKKKIDTNIFVFGSVKRLEKSQGFWPWFGPITGLLREYNGNGYTLMLSNKDKSINVRLMSLTDSDKVNSAIEFIHNNSSIIFPKTN